MLWIYGWLAGLLLLLSVLLWVSNLAEVDRVLSKPRRMIKALRHRSRHRHRLRDHRSRDQRSRDRRHV